MIVYLTMAYPIYSTTFTRAEVERLPVTVWSLRFPPARYMTEELQAEIKDTRYVSSFGVGKVVAANLRAAFGKRAGRWWRTVFGLVWSAAPKPIEMAKTKLHFFEAVALGEQLLRDGCQLVHVQFADSAATYACVVQRVFGIPYTVAVHAHDIFMRRFPPALTSRRIGEAVAIRVISDFNRRWMDEHFGIDPDRCEIIRCGVDPAAFTATGPSDDDPPLLLAVGRLAENKGFRFLIPACRTLRDRGCQFRCRIVGSGPEEASLRQKITDLDLTNTVDLAGVVPHTAMADEFARAAVFVLPSCVGASGEMDGIPVAMMEAMARALPVVSTRLTGIPEMVREGENGLLVDPEDAAGLADALAKLLDDRDLRRTLGQAGRATIVTEYDVDTNTAALLEMLRRHLPA